MKKYLFLAACLFLGGSSIAVAEPITNGKRRVADMQVWKSTSVAATAGVAVKLSNSAFIHSVIVSSPAAVDSSAQAILTIYGSQDGTGNILARIQTSTNEFTTGEVTRYPMDIYASSGLSVIFSTGNATGDQPGVVQILYAKGPPQDYKVWQSSWFASDVTTHTLAGGPVLLHKVVVTKAATGTSNMRIYNNNSASPTASTLVSQIDLTAGHREYDFDVALSSGLQVNIDQNGTISGEVMFYFKKNFPRDWEYWTPYFASGTITTRRIYTGRGVFGGVLNGDNIALSQMTVYNSSGTATTPLALISGQTVFDFDDANYEVATSSGLTFSSVGNGQYTIRYRRLR